VKRLARVAGVEQLQRGRRHRSAKQLPRRRIFIGRQVRQVDLHALDAAGGECPRKIDAAEESSRVRPRVARRRVTGRLGLAIQRLA